MYIVVAPPEAPTVREPEDLKRLSVVASSRLELAEVTASLRAVGLARGSAEQERLTIDASMLRALASDALLAEPTPQWQSGFDAMLAYAESKGWYRVDTGIVEAHIDWHA